MRRLRYTWRRRPQTANHTIPRQPTGATNEAILRLRDDPHPRSGIQGLLHALAKLPGENPELTVAFLVGDFEKAFAIVGRKMLGVRNAWGQGKNA